MNSKNLKIDNDNSERRLDNYLFSIYKSLPKSKIYSMIRKGEVRVNSKRIKPSYKLKSEDEIRIPPYLINYREHLIQVKIPQKRIDIYKKSVLFDFSKELPINQIIKSKIIGLTSGASAPEKLIQNFISEVKKHCDVSVEEIVTTKEKVTFKLPKALN